MSLYMCLVTVNTHCFSVVRENQVMSRLCQSMVCSSNGLYFVWQVEVAVDRAVLTVQFYVADTLQYVVMLLSSSA